MSSRNDRGLRRLLRNMGGAQKMARDVVRSFYLEGALVADELARLVEL